MSWWKPWTWEEPSWRLWAWQRLQQLIGAGVIGSVSLAFLLCLALGWLPTEFGHDLQVHEIDEPTIEHWHILTAIRSCHKQDNSVPGGLRNVPEAKRATYEMERQYQLSPFERAAIFQSDCILTDRLSIAAQIDQRQDRLRRNQLRILLLSAAAAFFVGMKTLFTNKDLAFRSVMAGALVPISVCALLMPVVGTALSGVVAFDGDAAVAIRQVRAIAQLEQLHGRIATDLTTDPYLCRIIDASRAANVANVSTSSGTTPNDPIFANCLFDRFNRAGAWEQRHEHIMHDASPSLAQAGDLPGPGDNGHHQGDETGGNEQRGKGASSSVKVDWCQMKFNPLPPSPVPPQQPVQPQASANIGGTTEIAPTQTASMPTPAPAR
jgi:hypothetical protein